MHMVLVVYALESAHNEDEWKVDRKDKLFIIKSPFFS